jgi:protein O-GlcNAc transferase
MHHPRCGEALHLLALINHQQGHHHRAVERYKQAILIEPQQPLHHNNLGVALMALSKYAVAALSFQHALTLSSGYADAKCNLGLCFYHQNRLSQAKECFDETLLLNPLHDGALSNLGITYLIEHRYGEAAGCYEQLLANYPAKPEWYANLGSAYMRLDQYAKAAECFKRADDTAGGKPRHRISRSIALRAAGDLRESIRLLETVVAENPKQSLAIANLVVNLEHCCQWDKLELYEPMLEQSTRDMLAMGGVPDEDPMLNIRRCDDISINHQVSQAHSQRIKRRATKAVSKPVLSPKNHINNRITVGYLSYDFRNHPVSHQLFPLFKLHDRTRFRIIALSTGPDDGSYFRKTIISDSDDFIDMRQHGLNKAVEFIQDSGIDILVDLMGHSHHHRLEILALRPAPVQIECLGFLSTIGADFIDYMIADSVVAPETHQSFYTEKLIRLPHCYQMNHRELVNGSSHTSRANWGLPKNGMVFCCFNAAYKVDRALFDAWMRILEQTPGSVLWLNGANPLATENMLWRAQFLGIDPERLIFAEKIPLEQHLNRLQLADLALDTIRYNGGATTANALSVGLPVITVMGKHWVSRMAASHLYAAGLDGLALPSMRAYEEKAVELATRPEALGSLRQQLAYNLGVRPVFDPHQFVRHLEAGYAHAWNRHILGLPPDHINISSDGVHQS